MKQSACLSRKSRGVGLHVKLKAQHAHCLSTLSQSMPLIILQPHGHPQPCLVGMIHMRGQAAQVWGNMLTLKSKP